MAFLSVQNVALVVLGYPLSWLELFGTVFNVWAVGLMIRRSVWTWPVGIIAVLLFGALFYQVRLYSDLVEQGYYLLTNLWGWWLWTRAPAAGETAMPVSRTTARQNAGLAGAVAVTSLALGWSMTRVHLWLPVWFPQPAAFPYLDALTSAMGLYAQVLAALRKYENWHLWLIVNAISVALYVQQGIRFVAVLYAAFFLLAIKGLLAWKAELPASSPSPDLAGEGGVRASRSAGTSADIR